MRSVQHTSLALSFVAFSSVLAPPAALHAQDPRVVALETLRAMGLDSVDGAATVHFRAEDRVRALELQSMMQEFLGFWNPRLNVELHVRVAVLRPDDWSKVTPLPYGFPNNFGPPANLILAPATPEPPSGLDTILVESGRDGRDWLLVAHEGGHLLTLALLPPAMRESALVPKARQSKDVRERFERLGSVPMWYWEYVANLFATGFLEAARPPEAGSLMKYLRAWTATPSPQFTHLDDWSALMSALMRARTPDGKPAFTSSDAGANFGWYQGVVGQLAAHVQSRREVDALSHIRRVTSGDVSRTTAEIVGELEAMAPGARALLDRLGAGYRSRGRSGSGRSRWRPSGSALSVRAGAVGQGPDVGEQQLVQPPVPAARDWRRGGDDAGQRRTSDPGRTTGPPGARLRRVAPVADQRLPTDRADVADRRTGLLISNVRVFDVFTGTFLQPMAIRFVMKGSALCVPDAARVLCAR